MDHLVQKKSVTITITETGKEPIVLNDVSEYAIITDGKRPLFSWRGNAFLILGLLDSAYERIKKITAFD